MALHHPGFKQPYAPLSKDTRGYYRRHVPELETPRLYLRRWQENDLQPFGEMRLDGVGMEFFPSVVSPVVSLASIEQFEKNFDTCGYGFWAVESVGTGAFVGCVGLYPRAAAAGVPPRVAIGWQLARTHWGQGYAKEAAHAVLKDGFKRLKLNEIIAVIAESNHRSRGLAEALGMMGDAAPFIEPAPGEQITPLHHQRLYRIRSAAWRKITR